MAVPKKKTSKAKKKMRRSHHALSPCKALDRIRRFKQQNEQTVEE